jgi:hypothetical protein
MRKWLTVICGFFIAIGFTVLEPASHVAAEANPKSEIVITSFQNLDPKIAGKPIRIRVHVQRDEIDNPTQTLKDEDQAMVYAFFTKEKDNRQTTLTLSKNGLYEGTITLPTAGTWKVHLMALATDPALGKNGTDTMETTWKVGKAHTPAWVWVVTALAAIILILLIILILRAIKRRKRHGQALMQAQKAKRKKNKKKK